jgi:hypothetical protein
VSAFNKLFSLAGFAAHLQAVKLDVALAEQAILASWADNVWKKPTVRSAAIRSDALICSTACRVRAHRNGEIKRLREIAERSCGRARRLKPWPWILGRR